MSEEKKKWCNHIIINGCDEYYFVDDMEDRVRVCDWRICPICLKERPSK